MLNCSAYTGVPGISPADLLSPTNGFDEQPVLRRLWRAGQVSTGQASLSDLTKPPRVRVIDQGLGFAPHKRSVSEQTWSPGSCCCPRLCRWDVLRATRPQGSIIYLCTECHLLCLANYGGIVAAQRTLISSHPIL